jgi:hypothetical protein
MDRIVLLQITSAKETTSGVPQIRYCLKMEIGEIKNLLDMLMEGVNYCDLTYQNDIVI